MRSDNIEISSTLWNSPKVMQLSALLQQSEPATIGYLYRFWALCSEYAKAQGTFLRAVTPDYFDRTTGLSGFGDALVKIRAIEQSEGGLRILWTPRDPLTASPDQLKLTA